MLRCWSAAKRYGNLTVLVTRMNPDLAMGDELLKKTGAGNLFMVFGDPRQDATPWGSRPRRNQSTPASGPDVPERCATSVMRASQRQAVVSRSSRRRS